MTLTGQILGELRRREQRAAADVAASRVVRVNLSPAALARITWEVAGRLADKEAADAVLEALTWRHPAGLVWYCDTHLEGEAYRILTAADLAPATPDL